jgi:transglutaminase-like putative cysteine protease
MGSINELTQDFNMVVNGMPNRNGLGVINNIMGAFGFTTMVCGDQAVYTAASLEQMGWNARVVNGERNMMGMTATHSWIEVQVDGQWIEADPWARATIPSNNASEYNIVGRWDIQRDQAESILNGYRQTSGANNDLEPNIYAQLIQENNINISSQGVTGKSTDDFRPQIVQASQQHLQAKMRDDGGIMA